MGSSVMHSKADLSLCWAHRHFVGFVMRWLIFSYHNDPKYSNRQAEQTVFFFFVFFYSGFTARQDYFTHSEPSQS